MTAQTVYTLLTIGLTLVLATLYVTMQRFQEYHYQKRIINSKYETDYSEILQQGLEQILSIKEQISNQPDDNKRLVLRRNITFIIKTIHPVAKLLGHTDIAQSLKDEFNEQHNYIQILEMVERLETNPPSHRTYNEVI